MEGHVFYRKLWKFIAIQACLSNKSPKIKYNWYERQFNAISYMDLLGEPIFPFILNVVRMTHY